MSGKKIVVIGGGFGGVQAARTARSLLDSEHQVTLVDRDSSTYLCGSFPLLIVGEREPEGLRRDLEPLSSEGVGVVQAEVRSLDLESRTVTTSSGVLEYDYLVLSPGAVYDWDAVPGAASAHSFYNLKTAERMRKALDSFRGGRVVIAVSAMPYKCPPAPFETALVLDWAFRQRGIRPGAEVHVYTPEPAPMGVAGPEAGARLLSDLDGRGIQVHTGAAVTEVGRDGRQAQFSDGSAIEADIIATIPVHRAPQFVRDAGLVSAAGWVEVRPDTMETSVPGVYAIGDVAAVPMANGRPMPKAGVFASSQGETVGRNIAAGINGKGSALFPGVGYCFLLYGGGQAGMVQGEFLAPGSPKVRFQSPSVEGYEAKERFEEDWLSFRV